MKRFTHILAVVGGLALAATGCSGELDSFDPAPDTGGTPDDTPDENPDDLPDTPPVPTNPDDPGNPGGGNAPQDIFLAQALDPVSVTCGTGGACHYNTDPVFLSQEPVQSYNLIMGQSAILFQGFDATNAYLITQGTGGAHYGATFTPEGLAGISAWLDAEKLAADAGGGQASAMQVWSGCMNLTDWLGDPNNDDDGVSQMFANVGSNAGNCEQCHNLGEKNMYATDDDVRAFTDITTSPSHMRSYFTLDATGTNVIINQVRLESVARVSYHPQYNIDGNRWQNAMAALQAFYDATNARMLAGDCAPPRF